MKKIELKPSKQWDFIDITDRVQNLIEPGSNEYCLVYCPHTSASIVVGENENVLLKDLENAASTMFASSRPFLHTMHGHLSGESHTFCFFHGFEVLIPVINGKLVLGLLQKVFFVESTGPREREVWVFSVKA